MLHLHLFGECKKWRRCLQLRKWKGKKYKERERYEKSFHLKHSGRDWWNPMNEHGWRNVFGYPFVLFNISTMFTRIRRRNGQVHKCHWIKRLDVVELSTWRTLPYGLYWFMTQLQNFASFFGHRPLRGRCPVGQWGNFHTYVYPYVHFNIFPFLPPPRGLRVPQRPPGDLRKTQRTSGNIKRLQGAYEGLRKPQKAQEDPFRRPGKP